MLTYILEKIKSKLRNNERKRKGSGCEAGASREATNRDIRKMIRICRYRKEREKTWQDQ